MKPASLESTAPAKTATPMPKTQAPLADSGPDARASTADNKAAADNKPNTAPSDVAADNTKKNERDRNSAALTPMDQNNNQTDLKITQQIRQAVMADGSLSFTAKNVKIITQNGHVTLRGPVNSEKERAAIEAAARRVAGTVEVDNQIEVKK
jgi:hyperosmotically inducible periplasmic protein